LTDIKLVTNADLGTPDIVGGDDWDDMATKVNSYINDAISPPSYIIYKSGSNTKSFNTSTKAVSTNADSATVIQAAIDALGTFSGKRIFIKSGVYSITSTLNFTAGNGYCHIVGEDRMGTFLQASGDFSVMDINNKNFVNLQDLCFYHTQSGYTSSILKIGNGSTNANLFRCQFNAGGNKVGNAVELVSNTAATYRNRFVDCLFVDFENCIFANVPNSTYFITNCRFTSCEFNSPKRVLKVTAVSSGVFDDNTFTDCELQSYSGTLCGWDYETGHSGHSFYTVHVNCMAQDLPVGVNYALLNTGTQITLVGCYPSWKIGGAGASSAKIRVYDFYSDQRGKSTQSGDGSTKVFNIAHGLIVAPTSARVSMGSADARGTPSVTFDTTNIILTYPTAPPSGTNNLIWNWEASVF
jgi:hypothetical protein